MSPQELSLQEAAATIAEARAYEEPLRRRTEGVTWMLWGLITAGVIASGSALELLLPLSHPVYAIYPFLWLGAGVLGTKAVWSIAGVSLPPTREGMRRSAVAIILAAATVAVVWLGAIVLVPVSALPAFILLGLGAPWVALGMFNPHRVSRSGRTAMVASGAAMFLAALLMIPSLGPNHDASFHLMAVVGTFVGCGAPFIAGAVQALRG